MLEQVVKDTVMAAIQVEKFQRAFYPPIIIELKEQMQSHNESLEKNLRELQEKQNFNDNRVMTIRIIKSLMKSISLIVNCRTDDFGSMLSSFMKAYGVFCRTQEMLFSLLNSYDIVNKYFVETKSVIAAIEKRISRRPARLLWFSRWGGEYSLSRIVTSGEFRINFFLSFVLFK